MARTGSKGNEMGLAVVRRSQELATMGLESGLWAKEDVDRIFETVARDCVDPRDRWLFLRKCQAHGLNPIKGQLFAIARYDKKLQRDTVTFVTSYHVFVSRARQAGFILQGSVVREKDDFVYDAIAGTPQRHTFDQQNRGALLGAYAFARDAETGEVRTGCYWPKSELESDSPNPLRGRIPGHFMWKTAVCRVARLVAPDLDSLYAAEEFGKAVFVGDGDAPEEVRELAALPIAEQLNAQRPPVIDVTPASESSDDAAAHAPVDEPLDFKTRAAVLRALGMRGVSRPAEIRANLASLVGREIADPKALRESDRASLASLIKEGASR